MRNPTRFSFLAAALFAFASAQSADRPASRSDDTVHGVAGVDALVAAFDAHPVVALGDLEGCAELHAFVRELIADRRFEERVSTIVVDFGNPSLQAVVDRAVLEGETVAPAELRRVWDDTTESPNLTFDSTVYARFFETLRQVNASRAKEQRLRVVLADAPIDWKTLDRRDQWLAARGEPRERALAEAISRALDGGGRTLVIAASSHLVRTGRGAKSARMRIDAEHPGAMLTVLPQGRLGDDARRAKIELAERQLACNSAIDLGSGWLGKTAIDDAPGSATLRESAELLLFLDDAERLTRVQAPGSIFADDEFWSELNRRWRIVRTDAFDLARAGFDASGSLDDVSLPLSSGMPAARSTARPPRADAALEPPPDAVAHDGLEFVEQTLDRFPIVGLGDLHLCAEFQRFVQRVVRDPKLVGKLQEFIVEFGNPAYQALLDRYVLEGEAVPLERRQAIWREAAMGWYAANSPVYAEFFDAVREVNAKLPRERRVRVVLGDVPIDLAELRANPAEYLSKLGAKRETAEDPREISLASSILRALALGHRAIVIAGNGHLRAAGGRQNARTAVEQQHPGAFFLIDANGPEYPGWRADSIVVSAKDGEPHHAKLYLGEWESLTGVRPSPLLARDRDYWQTIGIVEQITRHRRIDFTQPPYEYVSRYFAKPQE